MRIASPVSQPPPAADETPWSADGERMSTSETANYVGTMAQSLEDLAKGRDLPFLAYLLGMVVEEARRIIAGSPARHSKGDPTTR